MGGVYQGPEGSSGSLHLVLEDINVQGGPGQCAPTRHQTPSMGERCGVLQTYACACALVSITQFFVRMLTCRKLYHRYWNYWMHNAMGYYIATSRYVLDMVMPFSLYLQQYASTDHGTQT